MKHPPPVLIGLKTNLLCHHSIATSCHYGGHARSKNSQYKLSKFLQEDRIYLVTIRHCEVQLHPSHFWWVTTSYKVWNPPLYTIVKEPNAENCLDLISAAPPCEKFIIVPDTNCIISAIRKFMLDMPSPGSFQNLGLLLIWAQQGSELVKPCGLNRVKIEGAQLKINLYSPILHWMLIKNGKELWWSDASLQSYWNVKFMKNTYVSLCQHFFVTLSCNNSVRKYQITMVLWQFLIGIQCTIVLCKLIFHWASSIFT